MTQEMVYDRQLRSISEETASCLPSNGIVMSCMRELASLYDEW